MTIRSQLDTIRHLYLDIQAITLSEQNWQQLVYEMQGLLRTNDGKEVIPMGYYKDVVYYCGIPVWKGEPKKKNKLVDEEMEKL